MSVVVLYALLDQAPRAVPRGLDDATLRFLGTNGAIAAVSDHETAPGPSEPTLRAHDAAIRALCEATDAVLPARFGQTFADDRALLDMLAPRREAIRAGLDRVRGCVQMTLRLMKTATDAATDTATAPATDPATATAPAPGPGAQYLQSRARSHSPPEFSPVRGALAPIVREEQLAPAASPTLPWRTSLFHLVPREQITDYRDALERTLRELPAPITASGPWPPYAFAEGVLR